MELNKIIQGDALQPWPCPDKFLDTIVTSPPYWGLRDYGVAGQLGMEKTPEEFIANMVKVFREAHRCLKDTGTLWINIGDTYYGGKGANGASQAHSQHTNAINKKALVNTAPGEFRPNDRPHPLLKAKDLVGIPWMMAFALRADGWYLRQDIIWAKPNPMPESVTDRCTKSHEYIFLFTKARQYYFNSEAIMHDMAGSSIARLNQDLAGQSGSDRVPGKTNGPMKAVGRSGNKERKAASERGVPEGTGKNQAGSVPWEGDKANKRSVWTIPTRPFKGAHFATFPPDLIVDCIKAGCPPGGVVGEPFTGAGTTPIVARKLDRNFWALEIKKEYIDISEKRITEELGLFI